MNDHSRRLLPTALPGLLLSLCLLATPLQADPAALPSSPLEQPASALALPDNHPPLTPPDLSPLGMYRQADAVVKGVMIGLLMASVLTWTLWLAKSLELISTRRRLSRGIAALRAARTLQDAERLTPSGSMAHALLRDAQDELSLSGAARAADGIRERVGFRLERLVAANGRQMSQGTGMLASIGATAPFVGLFGTVWGIMNSFIGIAQAQTSNLAVVAPGIAEALLATAMGLVAAIPAVLIYNQFARSIGAYKALLGDAAAQILLLVSRDLDQPPVSLPKPLAQAACA